MVHKVLVWDLPTRCFHWLLALAVLGLVVSGEWGGGMMAWHYRLGILVLALLVFRLVWGFVGGHWSRFASFVLAPGRLVRHLKSAAPVHSVGHNPLGGYAVISLLLLLALQAGSGLCSDDGVLSHGPFAPYLPQAWVSRLTYLHTTVFKGLLLGMVLLHVAAIAWHRVVRADSLLGPMVHGYKWLEQPAPASADNLRSRLLAVLTLLLACAALASLLLA